MTPLTMQQVFDKVARHLLTQRERAVDPSTGQCQYRTVRRGIPGAVETRELKCAVGCLINDEFYDPAIEGMSAGFVSPNNNTLLAHVLEQSGVPVDRPTLDLLHHLQRLHDASPVTTPVSDWPIRLRAIAESFGLSAAVVDQCVYENGKADKSRGAGNVQG